MKNRIFENCDKCIGITPFILNHKGVWICDYCKTRIARKKSIESPSVYKFNYQEKIFF